MVILGCVLEIMINSEDNELVKRVKAGDILAYELLVKKYEVKLFWFLKKWTKEESLIEEVIQDSLFKLYKGIHKVNEKKGFSAYLYTIAKNQLMDRFRSDKKTLSLMESVVGVDGEKLYEDIHKKDIQEQVREALANLKEQQRKVIELYFFEELSYKKIGEKMGVPINTIKTNIRRAKNKLLSLMKNEKR
jgi:RNA polymerase sigma-70 factor (ECF subfamily)